MYYDKKIRYLEYLENGEKIKSAGFVKIEIMDENCNIQVNVTGLHPSESCSREVRLMGTAPADTAEIPTQREGVLGEIALQSGRGTLIRKRVPTDKLCEGIGYNNLTTVRINLGKSRELVCRWRDEQPKVQDTQLKVEDEQPEASDVSMILSEHRQSEPPQPALRQAEQPQPALRQAEQPQPAPRQAEQPQPESWQPEPSQTATQQPELPQSAPRQAEPPQPEPWQPEAPQPAHQPALRVPVTQSAMQPAMPTALHEKKWRQLSEIYPHIAPFRDERDYLSIGPGDFVILPEKYYRLINNSFLLHGFYNYGHMVLARTTKRGEEKYYIGVPGNFYEKERQVAIMFGFESFECRQEPAREGDFGYYMIRVEL